MASGIKSSHTASGNLQVPRKARSKCMAGIINAAVFLAVTGLVVAVYLSPLQGFLTDGLWVKQRLALFGLSAPLVFTFGSALLTVVGTPRLLLCSLGGMVFGFAWGLIWTQLGTLLGSYVIFLSIRWFGRDYVLRHCSHLRGFSQRMATRGFMSVVLIRQLPIHGFYNNVLLGLAPVGHGDFLLGSLVGFLPLGIAACLLGAGLIQRNLLQGVEYLALGLACSVVLGFILKRLFNKLSVN